MHRNETYAWISVLTIDGQRNSRSSLICHQVAALAKDHRICLAYPSAQQRRVDSSCNRNAGQGHPWNLALRYQRLFEFRRVLPSSATEAAWRHSAYVSIKKADGHEHPSLPGRNQSGRAKALTNGLRHLGAVSRQRQHRATSTAHFTPSGGLDSARFSRPRN